jgi:pilus assembly protein TadC
MLHLALLHLAFGGPFDNEAFGLWMFLSIGAVSLFVIFIPTVHYIDARRKEREAYYKAETLRRLAEASGEGAQAALQMLREEDRQARVKVREGMKIGGLINLGVGVALLIFLRALIGNEPVYLCGLIPGFIGVAMLTYALFLAPPVE